MPGPLPDPNAVRRNAPTIPTTTLSVNGRRDANGNPLRAPTCPYKLGTKGRKFWNWAWKLPQALAWDDGSHYALGRRAVLEDELDALEAIDKFDMAELLEGDADFESLQALSTRLRVILGSLKARAGGATTIMREMRELDKRFGLDPKAVSEMRLTFAPAEPDKAAGDGGTVTDIRSRARAV